METYTGDMMEDQLAEFPYLNAQLDVEQMAYQMQDPNSMTSSIKSEIFGHFMGGAAEEFEYRTDRSFSCSGASSQSLSPQPHHYPLVSQHPERQIPGHMLGISSDMISPKSSMPTSGGDPSDEDHKTERRRAQNRAAQRAYRQRKDQSLKQREKEVETLRDELDKAQRLNRTLCKVVAVLRERLKEPHEMIEAP